jgi:hypothetical protein
MAKMHVKRVQPIRTIQRDKRDLIFQKDLKGFVVHQPLGNTQQLLNVKRIKKEEQGVTLILFEVFF